MKVDFFVEFGGNRVDYNTLVTKVKELWKLDGNLVRDIESVEIYFKPEESMCYYVINDQNKGSFDV